MLRCVCGCEDGVVGWWSERKWERRTEVKAERDRKRHRADGMSSCSVRWRSRLAARADGVSVARVLGAFETIPVGEARFYNPNQFALIRAAAQSPDHAKVVTGSHLIIYHVFCEGHLPMSTHQRRFHMSLWGCIKHRPKFPYTLGSDLTQHGPAEEAKHGPADEWVILTIALSPAQQLLVGGASVLSHPDNCATRSDRIQ